VQLIISPEPHEHRQECLCHTGSVLHQHLLEYGRIHVAQTLLSVLWQDSVKSINNDIEALRDEH
jgi:hypothetical protein